MRYLAIIVWTLFVFGAGFTMGTIGAKSAGLGQGLSLTNPALLSELLARFRNADADPETSQKANEIIDDPKAKLDLDGMSGASAPSNETEATNDANDPTQLSAKDRSGNSSVGLSPGQLPERPTLDEIYDALDAGNRKSK